MPKLSRNMYTTAKGERKLNCYGVNIPKEVVNKTDLEGKELKIRAEGNKIIIEKAEWFANYWKGCYNYPIKER